MCSVIASSLQPLVIYLLGETAVFARVEWHLRVDPLALTSRITLITIQEYCQFEEFEYMFEMYSVFCKLPETR